MILGYEQPVDIPVQSIYDKGMMQMYLQALQKDYEQGVAEEKEFLSNFGNFTSPIAADIDAWNERTIDPIINYLNQNPNALRSVEGRNAISRFIATRPYGDLAKLRQSAENAKLYQKAWGDLYSKGLLDPDAARYFDGDMTKWNTLDKNKVWEYTSPTMKKTMDNLLSESINTLKKQYKLNPEKSKNGWIVSDVSPDRVASVMKTNLIDLKKSPWYNYYKNQSGLSDKDFDTSLIKYVQDSLDEKREYDQVWALRTKMAFDAAENAKNRDNAMEIAKLKLKNPEQKPVLTDKIEERTRQKTVGDRSQKTVNHKAFINYFKNLTDATKDKTLKQRYEGYKKEWENYYKLSEDDKAKFLKKYKYIDDNGILTDKYYKYLDKATGVWRGKNTTNRSETIQNAQQYYSRNLVQPSGDEVNVLLDHIAKGNKKGNYYQITFGNNVRYTRARALDYSGLHKSSIPRSKDLTFAFDKWLRENKITGNAYYYNQMKTGKTEGGALEIADVGTTVSYDTIQKFIEFAKSEGFKMSNGRALTSKTDAADILSDLGVTMVNRDGTVYKVTKKSDGQSSSTSTVAPDYVSIPTSSTTNVVGSSLSGLNDKYQSTYNKYSYDDLMNAVIGSELFGN